MTSPRPSALAVMARGRALAQAKINLGLAVLGRRPDGYHDLASTFVRLALADELTVRVAGLAPTDDPDADMLAVVGSRPTDDPADDLVLRAAALLRAHHQGPLPALAFRLVKRIPVAAGLGGGSADAAAALGLAAAAWGLPLPAEARHELAASLGSDVPFFAAAVPAARVEGRGERLTPLPPPAGLGVLLVRPDLRLDTGAVFAAYDRLAAAGGPSPSPAAVGGPLPSEAARLATAMRDGNDLWSAAATLRPELPALRDRLEAALVRPVFMTGSGPTLVALYPSGAAARTAAPRVDGSGLTVIATRAA